MFVADFNGQIKQYAVADWSDDLLWGRAGHYGAFVKANYDMFSLMEAISSSDVYQGDGSFPGWLIMWG